MIPNVDYAIKVMVVAQSVTLNGITTTFTELPIGTIVDAVPEFYGETIVNYHWFSKGDTFYDDYFSHWRRFPLEIFKPLSKIREEKINSILED
jgi:hypothetical protein